MEPNEKREKELRIHWKKWLNYQSVVRQLPFFLFLSFLAVVYIYNGHKADKLARDITRTTRELKELQYEYKTVKGEVLFRSKQSELEQYFPFHGFVLIQNRERGSTVPQQAKRAGEGCGPPGAERADQSAVYH
jgi:hypothetical protein